MVVGICTNLDSDCVGSGDYRHNGNRGDGWGIDSQRQGAEVSRISCWVKNRRWNRQRKNGKLPECDCWDYKYTLADNIRQGMDYLLSHKSGDEKVMKDLTFIRNWARDFPLYESAIVVRDEQEQEQHIKEFGGLGLIITVAEAKEFDKRTEKAFKLLAKHIHALWD